MFNSWLLILLVCCCLINIYLFYGNRNLSNQRYQLTQKLKLNRQNRREEQEHLEMLKEEFKYVQAINKIEEIFIESIDINLNKDILYQKILNVVFDTLEPKILYLIQLITSQEKIAVIFFKSEINCDYQDLIKSKNKQLKVFVDDILDYSIDESLKTLQELLNIKEIPNKLILKGINFNISDKKNQEERQVLGLYSSKSNIFTPLAIEFIKTVVKQLEKAIKKNQQLQKYDLLERSINSSNNGIFITTKDPYRAIVYANKAFRTMTGNSEKEILSHNYQLVPKAQNKFGEFTQFNQAILQEKPTPITIRNYRQNGESFGNEIYYSPVYNNHGELTNFIGISYDITQKHDAKINLLRKTKELEIFNEQLTITNQINNNVNINLDKLLSSYLQKVYSIIEIDILIISELVGNKHNIISLHNSLSDENFYPQENNLINYFADKVLEKNSIFSYYKNNQDNNLNQKLFLQNANFAFYVGIPIYLGDNIYGILHLLNTSNDQSKFYDSQYLIEAISQRISRIINAQEIKLEKEQMNITLQESQERLSITLSSLEDIIWSIHPDTLQLTYINKSAEKLFHVPLNRLFQKRLYWLELIDENEKIRIQEKYSNLFNTSLFGTQNNYHDLEYRIFLEDGTEKYIRDRAHIICDQNGNQISINGIITDITSTIITQKALTKSEQEFRLMFELAPIGMIITNLQGNMIQVNYSFCELIQKPAKDLINQNETSLIHPDDLEKFLNFKRKIITESLEQDRQEICLLATNGSLVHTIFNVTVLRNDQGEIQQFIQQIIDVSELKIMGEQIFYDTFYDSLTGLPNRFLLIDRLKQYLKINHHRSKYSILLIDIDNFKKVNDSWGHKIGDELLILISEKMISCLGGNHVLARISGDEFIVFIPDIKSLEEVKNIAEKIMISCRINTTIRDKNVICSVSIGISLSDEQDYQPEEMIRNADLAMYFAKEKGKNCYQIFAPSMHLGLVKKINLESALSQVIEKDELELYYQPIINLKTGTIAGFEALTRWKSPLHGFVSPIDFIPIAEETGLIIPMGNWILFSAAQQVKQWQEKYPHLKLFIAVNVSSKQLLNRNFLEEVDSILQQTQINPSLLKIEITESILMQDYQIAQGLLRELKVRNLKISLDDFGTGYSSLSYLHSLPFDTLKIDQSFVQPLINPQQPTPIVEAIVNLADNLSLEVVAEGIESKLQETILKEIDCQYGQGYLYAEPLNLKQAEEFIHNKQAEI